MMSGTSLDGVDICHADFSQPQNPLIQQKEYPFPQDLKKEILDLCQNNSTTIEKVGLIDHKLGQLYANVVLKFTSEFKINTKDNTITLRIIVFINNNIRVYNIFAHCCMTNTRAQEHRQEKTQNISIL